MSSDSVELKDSWVMAESFVYGQTLQYLGSKDNVDAFQGYEPTPPDRDLWTLTSGGLGIGAVSRFAGASPCWSTIALKAEYVFIHENRLKAMGQSFEVLSMLVEKANFRSMANVQEFRIDDMPQVPQSVEVQQEDRNTGRIMWRVVLPMVLIFSTGTAFT